MMNKPLAGRALVGLIALLGWCSVARAAGEFVYPQSGYLGSVYHSPRPGGIHRALDISGPNLSPVGAARAGTVTMAGVDDFGGKRVYLQHEAGYETVYVHFAEIHVRVGQRVAAGQTLGLEGSTGLSNGPHVHFEIRRYGGRLFIPGAIGRYVAKGQPVPYRYPIETGAGPANLPPRVMEVSIPSTSMLNVRTGPGTNFSAIGHVDGGYRFVADREWNGWYRVYVDHRTGWCYGAFLVRRTGVTGRRITASRVDVYWSTSGTVPPSGSAVAGELFAQRNVGGGWVEIFFGCTWAYVRESGTATIQF